MNILTEFAQRAPDSPSTTAQQLIWANDGALNIARKLELLPTSGSINLVSGTQSYDLISNFSTFLKLDLNGGIHFYNGSDYSKLPIVTEDWLDTYVADWRNATNTDPTCCYKKGKDIFLYPTPGANYTNGLKVYYFAKPTAMTADGDDPFSDRTDLEDLHEGVVLFMLWKAKQALGEYLQAREAKAEYMQFLSDSSVWINKDEGVQDGIFRPYYKETFSSTFNPVNWGID